MLEKFVKSYYNFFDKKLKNSTLVVFLISILIILIWIIFSSDESLLYSRNSLLQANNTIQENVIIIDWIKYKIILKKLD